MTTSQQIEQTLTKDLDFFPITKKAPEEKRIQIIEPKYSATKFLKAKVKDFGYFWNFLNFRFLKGMLFGSFKE